jgi:uncharacterized protein
MSGPRFCRFELRTTDVAAARDFYEAVLGRDGDGIVELPAAAVVRGARPHWLGHVGVSGVGGVGPTARKLEDRGAMRLGAPRGGEPAIFRDPGGAIVALTEETGPSRAGVIWHHLNTVDAVSAAANYVELFGWALTEHADVESLGTARQFAWSAGEPSIGSIGDVAGRPGVHPHWTFFFGVASLDDAVGKVRTRGGLVLGPIALRSANGARIAVCDDAQGAAFGLMESENRV